MQKFKQKLRMLGFFLLILLAVIGAGMGGGIPVLPKKKDESEEIKIELVESDNNETPMEDTEMKP